MLFSPVFEGGHGGFGVIKTVLGFPFWLVGATPILEPFNGDWDVHRYGILTHGRFFFPPPQKARLSSKIAFSYF